MERCRIHKQSAVGSIPNGGIFIFFHNGFCFKPLQGRGKKWQALRSLFLACNCWPHLEVCTTGRGIAWKFILTKLGDIFQKFTNVKNFSKV